MKYYILVERRVVQCHDALLWAKWFGTHNRVVAKDDVEGVKVSTVFIGIDYSYSNAAHPPLVFETATFGPYDVDIFDRYSSWDAAESGHRALVKNLRAKLSKPCWQGDDTTK